MAHILVVDDDKDLCALLRTALERDGHQVSTRLSGREVDESACRWADCILLDVMMPGEDGFALCRRIRGLADCPILFLTAKTEEADVLTGLGLGGDDYLTKPIKMKLLVSRVQAILKRIDAEAAPAEPAAAGITVDRERYAVLRDGHEVALPRKEFALLDLLYSSPGKLFSREEIYAKIWGTEVVVGDRTIDVHIRKLRQKIGDERIVTIKGVGYKFEP